MKNTQKITAQDKVVKNMIKTTISNLPLGKDGKVTTNSRLPKTTFESLIAGASAKLQIELTKLAEEVKAVKNPSNSYNDAETDLFSKFNLFLKDNFKASEILSGRTKDSVIIQKDKKQVKWTLTCDNNYSAK